MTAEPPESRALQSGDKSVILFIKARRTSVMGSFYPAVAASASATLSDWRQRPHMIQTMSLRATPWLLAQPRRLWSDNIVHALAATTLIRRRLHWVITSPLKRQGALETITVRAKYSNAGRYRIR